MDNQATSSDYVEDGYTSSQKMNLMNVVNKLFEYVTNAVLVAGFIILLLCIGGRGRNPTMGVITGHGFILVGAVLFVSAVLTKMVQSKKKSAKTLLAGITAIGPFIVFIALIATNMILISGYFSSISRNTVADSYYNMLNLSIMNSLFITYFFYRQISDDKYKKTGVIDQVTGAGLYLLEIFGFVVTISMYIVLTYFRTDGFTLFNSGKSKKVQFNLDQNQVHILSPPSHSHMHSSPLL